MIIPWLSPSKVPRKQCSVRLDRLTYEIHLLILESALLLMAPVLRLAALTPRRTRPLIGSRFALQFERPRTAMLKTNRGLVPRLSSLRTPLQAVRLAITLCRALVFRKLPTDRNRLKLKLPQMPLWP